MEIRVLDKATIDKIAAGEVVERPANIVKELMENSIDSGADAISVEIRDGGKSLIRITDNGCGIDKDQIRTAFLRHATSKIKTADDLSFVTTLGFRGEALSSIAAVAEVELCTKTADSLTGSIYKISGGIEKSFEDAGLPNGTTMIVSNIFANVPARLKFLASAQSEGNIIADSVEKIALSHPEIAVKFVNNGSVKLNTSGNGSLKDVIYAIYGKELASNLLEVHFTSQLLSIDGFIGKPEIQRSNRLYENFFVNGRYVKDKILSSAVENAYKGYQMKGSYPFTCFNISIEPELMDVNVHPSKREIRFFNNQQIYTCIYDCINRIISGRENIPSFTIDTKADIEAEKHIQKLEARDQKVLTAEPFESSRKSAAPVIPPVTKPQQKEVYTFSDMSPVSTETVKEPELIYKAEQLTDKVTFQEKNSDFVPTVTIQADTKTTSKIIRDESSQTITTSETAQKVSEEDPQIASEESACLNTEQDTTECPQLENVQLSFFDDSFISKEARPKHRIIGEAFNTYWIVEYENSIYIIDQHAAHEKVNYERFMTRLRAGNYTSQYISPGIVVTLSAAEESCMLKYMDDFTRIGFEIEHFGGSEYIISAVPSELYGLNSSALFTSFLDELNDSVINTGSEMLMDKIATAACKASVKGGDKISLEEANALIDELLSLDNPYNCPHGRPTIITMTKYELEKKFKRII